MKTGLPSPPHSTSTKCLCSQKELDLTKKECMLNQEMNKGAQILF